MLLSSSLWLGQQLMGDPWGTTPAIAQVIPDRSLGPESSTVQNRFRTQQIGGGATRGTTLFHSFSMFNLGANDRAYFDSPTGISTIFSRVTGKSASTIDGTLGISGRANLFFMNPNGILFGKNARLDLQGTATFTTADRIKFGDTQAFAADANQSVPLLTVNLPTGLQWGKLGRAIVSQGANLQMPAGQTLRLFGSGVNLQSSAIRTREGTVTIASVSQNETLSLNPNGTPNLGQTRLAPVTLSETAIDVSGNSAGAVSVSGSRVTMQQGTGIFADVFGDGKTSLASGIQITGTDRIEILGDPVRKQSTFIMSDTLKIATGNSQPISITTPNLILKDGGRIQTRTYGAGNGGDITVRSFNIEASGGLVGVPLPNGTTEDIATGIVSRVEEGATGNGGNVILDSDRINLTGGPEFRASTRSAGRAGNFTVTAKDITLTGGSLKFLTGFSTSTGNGKDATIAGRGGDLSITSDRLTLLNGASVRTGTSGRGDAGNLTLTVRELLVAGLDPIDGTQSSVSTSSNAFTRPDGSRVQPSGRSGNLTIDAQQVKVLDGGAIRSNSAGSGNAGNLTIRSQSLDVAGWQQFNVNAPNPANRFLARSVISNAASGSGDAGLMTLTSDRFSVRNGAQVSAATRGSGAGGTMIVTAGTVDLTGAAPDERFPTGLFVSVESRATGNGGVLRLQADRLTITDGSAISADTFGAGRASDVWISVKDSILIRGMGPLGLIPSRIGSAARLSLAAAGLPIPTGSGGNLSVKAGSLTIDQGGILTAATVGIGNAGAISVTADQVALHTGGQILVGSRGQGNAGDIKLHTHTLDLDQGASIRAETSQGTGGNILIDSRDRVFINNKSSMTTDARNNANGGNITIKTKLLVQSDNSSITANAVNGRGGTISIEADGILSSRDSQISASSELGIRGTVSRTTPVTDDRSATNSAEPEPVAPDQVLANSCFVQRNEKQGRFVAIGNGGLPESPTEAIVAAVETAPVVPIEGDVVAKTKAIGKPQTKLPSSISSPERLEEATELRRSADGSLSLAVGKPVMQPKEQAVCDR